MNSNEQDHKMRAIEEMERELAEPLRNFRGAVTALAEHEAERMPRVSLKAEKKAVWWPAWSYAWVPAGLLVLLMAVGLMMSSHNRAQVPMNEGSSMAKVEQAPVPQTQAHVSDAALMTEIDDDLNQNAPTPLAPLEVTTTSQTQTNSTQAETTYGMQP